MYNVAVKGSTNFLPQVRQFCICQLRSTLIQVSDKTLAAFKSQANQEDIGDCFLGFSIKNRCVNCHSVRILKRAAKNGCMIFSQRRNADFTNIHAP